MEIIFVKAIKSIKILYLVMSNVSKMIIPRDITEKRRFSQRLPLLAKKSLEKYE